nr:MAG TPA: hypothetical protein [Caudoviricetes sp.]
MTNNNTFPRVRPISYFEYSNVRLCGCNYVIDIDGETFPVSLSTVRADSEDVILCATFTPTGDPIQVVYTPDFDIYRMILK